LQVVHGDGVQGPAAALQGVGEAEPRQAPVGVQLHHQRDDVVEAPGRGLRGGGARPGERDVQQLGRDAGDAHGQQAVLGAVRRRRHSLRMTSSISDTNIVPPSARPTTAPGWPSVNVTVNWFWRHRYQHTSVTARPSAVTAAQIVRLTPTRRRYSWEW